MKALAALIGGKVEAATLVDDECFVLTVRMPAGERRVVNVYERYESPITVTVDGAPVENES